MKKFWQKQKKEPAAPRMVDSAKSAASPPTLSWCVEHRSALQSCGCQPGIDRSVASHEKRPTEPVEADRPNKTQPAIRKAKKPSRANEAPAAKPSTGADDQRVSAIDRLANMGWTGRRLARRRLHEQSDLEMGDKRRLEIAKTRKARADARRDRITNAAPNVVYLLAVGFAIGGQVTVFAGWMGSDWGQLAHPSLSQAFVQVTVGLAVALGAAAFVEGAGLGFASVTTKARLAGRPAHLTRIATWVCAFAACGINAAGHWGSVFAWPTALGSLVALLLWEMETHARCFDILTKTRAQLRREAAIRRLTRDCLQVSYPRTQVRQIMATLTIPQMEALVAEVIDPMKVARAAMRGFTALQHAAQEKPKGKLARLWAWLPFTGSGVRASVPLMPVPQPEFDEAELKRMSDGFVPADAPTSPAPTKSRSAEPANADRPETDRPIDRKPAEGTGRKPTGRPAEGTGRKPTGRPTENRPTQDRPTDQKPADSRPADEPAGVVDPADLVPADERPSDWMEQKLHERFAAVWAQCNSRPSGQQLAVAAGGSKSQANAWKRQHHPEVIAS